MNNLTYQGNFFVITNTTTGREFFRCPKDKTLFEVGDGNAFLFYREGQRTSRFSAIPFSELSGSFFTTIGQLIESLSTELSAVPSGGGIGGGVSLGETSTTAYRGDRGKEAYDHSLLTASNPHGTTSGQITEDVDKRFVTDAEKTNITHVNRSILDLITESFTTALKSAYDSASSWVSTNGANVLSKLNLITITQAVNLDQIEEDTAVNNAKVSNATHTGDVTGSGVLTLATVNANVGSFTNANITVDAKGRITTASNGAGAGGGVAINKIRLATDFPTVAQANTTRIDIPGFQINVVAGKSYEIALYGLYRSAATTTGGSIGFVLTSGTGSIIGNVQMDITQTMVATGLKQVIRAISSSGTLAGSFATGTGVGVINSPHGVTANLVFHCATTGVLSVQWGTEVANSLSQILADSTIVWNEIT